MQVRRTNKQALRRIHQLAVESFVELERHGCRTQARFSWLECSTVAKRLIIRIGPIFTVFANQLNFEIL